MANPTVTDYLKYANLQMAAEAFIRDPVTLHLAATGDELKTVLIEGNGHASIFPNEASFGDRPRFRGPESGPVRDKDNEQRGERVAMKHHAIKTRRRRHGDSGDRPINDTLRRRAV